MEVYEYMVGIGFILLSFIVVIALLVWGISYTRKNLNEVRSKKYRAAAFLCTLGLIFSISFVLGAKRFSDNIDVTIIWMILSTGLLFSSAVTFAISFINEYSRRENE
ncbi:hypothetical protein [Lederbergia lenta]|nr:hypothetical protein [Lederbergia lenta]MEC2325927.1 hypothetical protein [Lederbergia lenta]